MLLQCEHDEAVMWWWCVFAAIHEVRVRRATGSAVWPHQEAASLQADKSTESLGGSEPRVLSLSNLQFHVTPVHRWAFVLWVMLWPLSVESEVSREYTGPRRPCKLGMCSMLSFCLFSCWLLYPYSAEECHPVNWCTSGHVVKCQTYLLPLRTNINLVFHPPQMVNR